MPSKSKAQHNLMAMVAHDPAAAKRLGIPQKVGKEFSQADKGRNFKEGGLMATKKMAGGGDTIGKNANKQSKGMTKESMAKVRTAAPSKDGLAEKGRTKGTQVKMKGNTIGNGPLVNVKGPTFKRGGSTKK